MICGQLTFIVCFHLMSTGKRTSVLVFFGERIPQRDIVKQAEFTASTIYAKRRKK